MNAKPCSGGLPIELFERVSEVLKVLAHPHRLKIIEVLEHGESAPVFEISREIGLSQAATSQHLNHLKRAGIVAAGRRGKEVWYSVRDKRSINILKCIREKGCAEGK
ncbi:MAG: ArsR/SmtB family transcription factor [Kiritimatiellia bacterium]